MRAHSCKDAERGIRERANSRAVLAFKDTDGSKACTRGSLTGGSLADSAVQNE